MIKLTKSGQFPTRSSYSQMIRIIHEKLRISFLIEIEFQTKIATPHIFNHSVHLLSKLVENAYADMLGNTMIDPINGSCATLILDKAIFLDLIQ